MKTKHTVIPNLMRNPQLELRFCIVAQNDSAESNIHERNILSFRI